MINIPNNEFVNWLSPVNPDRRIELLCNIGVDQEKKGVSKKTIVKTFKQLFVSPLVKVEPLRTELLSVKRNEDYKEENLFLNSDTNVSVCSRENKCDTGTDEDVCLPIITSIIKSLRDNDEDSIEISLSEADTCENKENAEQNLEDILKNKENIKSSNTQNPVVTTVGSELNKINNDMIGISNKIDQLNEKLHSKDQEKGINNIGKTSKDIESHHEIKIKNKNITTNQPISCTNDLCIQSKDKMDTILNSNSFVVEKNKLVNKKQIINLKEMLRQRLESKNVSLPLSKNCKLLDTTNNIPESMQKLKPPINNLGVEFSTEFTSEEYTVINSSEVVESVQFNVGQFDKSTSELSTLENDESNNKSDRINILYSNSKKLENKPEMGNAFKELLSHTLNTPTNQRLPYKKRPADQRGTQSSKRRRKSSTEIVDKSLSLEQLLIDSSTTTQLSPPSEKGHENRDYSFLSRSLGAVSIPRRYSLDLNSSNTQQTESKVCLDASLRGKSNKNNKTKALTVDRISKDKELTEQLSCVNEDVESKIYSADINVNPSIIDNGYNLGNTSTDDSFEPTADQLLAVPRCTTPTNTAPVVPTCTVTENELPAVAICNVPASCAPSVPTCSIDEAPALLTDATDNQSPTVPTTCTVLTNEALSVPLRTFLANQTPAVPTSTTPANQSPTVLTCSVSANLKPGVPISTASTNQVSAVPTLMCNAPTNDTSKQDFLQNKSASLKHTLIYTAVSLFFDIFESNHTVNHVPPAIRSELLEFLKAKWKDVTRITDRDLLQLYMLCYIEFFDRDDVSAKINKSAEILHLAIADYNRKIERKKRALRLTSDIFRKQEEMRAHNEYLEMLNLRGVKFSEIFDSILVHFKNCASPMAVTLYYKITLALLNIDRENIIYIYTIRELILNLLKSAKGSKGVPPCCSNLFQAPNKDFEATYMFVKTCLVILHTVGGNKIESKNVLKFANLQPTSLKLNNFLNPNLNHHVIKATTAVGCTSQREGDITNTYRNPNINPNTELSTLKNNTNAIFAISQNTNVTAVSMEDQRQIQDTMSHPQHQLLQLQNNHRIIADQNNKFQGSKSELINQNQNNVADLELPHLISNNNMPNKDKYIAKQQITNRSKTIPSQYTLNNEFIQVTTPNSVLQNISKKRPSLQTPHRQTSLRHNTFTSKNLNQEEAEQMSSSVSETVRKSQEMEKNSLGIANVTSFNIPIANSQSASSCSSGHGRFPNPRNNLLISNRNLSHSQVCDVANCSVYASLACSLCKAMFYCSHDCQKRDWYSGHSKTCRGSRFPDQDSLN